MSEDFRKTWQAKVGALPRIPRGEDGYFNSILKILSLVRSGAKSNDEVDIKGSTSKKTLEQCCISLRPYGLVEKLPNHTWVISYSDDQPKLDEGPLTWFQYFATHTKFFGELLAKTMSPQSVSNLLIIANEQYHLGWRSNSPINSRLNWLMDMGLIEIINYQQYKITDKGTVYLDKILLIDSKYTEPITDSTINKEFSGFNSAVEKQMPTEENQLDSRKNSIGFFLGGNNSLLTNTTAVLSVITNQTTVRDIVDYSTKAFRVKESSVISYISMLAKTQLVEYRGQRRIALTEVGQAVANGVNWIDLFGIFHSRYTFMGEILSVVNRTPKSYKQISQIGRVYYGIESMSVSAVQQRCAILKSAQLIRTIGKKVTISALGEKVLASIVTSQRKTEGGKSLSTVQSNKIHPSAIIELITEVEDASRDSTHPARFERVLAQAFVRIGFDAKWIGGSGDTDIFVTTQTAAKYTYSFNVDAKATYSGSVGDSLVNFDALEQHRKLHNSDYVIVVGAQFSTERIIDWAKEHKVGLMDTHTLIEILEKHEELPLTADQYRQVFEQVGIISAEVLNNSRQVTQHNAYLMNALVKLLIKESRDPISGGQLSPKELYFLLRSTEPGLSQAIMDSGNPISRITAALAFLSSPFINVIGQNSGNYFVKGSRVDAAQKFQFYASCLQG